MAKRSPVNTMEKSSKIIRVTAAIIESGDKILIAQRKSEDDLFGGLWEFPGGKIEDGETPEECMARELKEELEIEAEIGILITSNKHRYPNGIFELLAYRVQHFSGNIVLNDHDKIKWISIDEISNYKFPPANTPIINYLKNSYE